MNKAEQVVELGQAVKAVTREIERRHNELLRASGITAPQAEALLTIHKLGPLSLKELGERLIAEAGHPSRMVDRLVEAGLVKRETARDDRRRLELTLTKRGKDLLDPMMQAQLDLLDWGMKALAGHDVEVALNAMHALLAASPYAAVLERRRQPG
jgi:MarR family transcriptional regulator, organic hydroperoxide resistance regulator